MPKGIQRCEPADVGPEMVQALEDVDAVAGFVIGQQIALHGRHAGVHVLGFVHQPGSEGAPDGADVIQRVGRALAAGEAAPDGTVVVFFQGRLHQEAGEGIHFGLEWFPGGHDLV